MKEAMFYETIEGGKVKCNLCAHRCLISEGKRGICTVRENVEGRLMSLVYGRVIAAHVDPIEKKPLFHFLSGSYSFSIATAGCNFKCLHCQNYEISQYPREHPSDKVPGTEVTPEEIVASAIGHGCKSISYTYTEPTIFFEFAYDTARLAKEKGLKNAFVSNGFMTPESAEAIIPYLDANNIDLKGDAEFYKKICSARVEPVKDTIKLMKERGVWVEVTTLVIPGLNDSEEVLKDIACFIREVDPDMPWHVSRFYPTYKLTDRDGTPVETLRRAREIGQECGLRFVYEGNVPAEKGENTYCPGCSELLIERAGYRIIKNDLKSGSCPSCGEIIKGLWH